MGTEDKPGGLRSRLRRFARRVVKGAPAQPSATAPAQIVFNERAPLAVPDGTTILVAARSADVDISHYCGGMASCGTCRIVVREGAENLSPIQPREHMVLGHESASAGDRLACQARIRGPVSVKVPRWF